jgi:hypothetical protein
MCPGLPALVEGTGATAYLPAGMGVEFEHVPLAGDVVEVGNTPDSRPRTRPGSSEESESWPACVRRTCRPWPTRGGSKGASCNGYRAR